MTKRVCHGCGLSYNNVNGYSSPSWPNEYPEKLFCDNCVINNSRVGEWLEHGVLPPEVREKDLPIVERMNRLARGRYGPHGTYYDDRHPVPWSDPSSDPTLDIEKVKRAMERRSRNEL